MMAAPAVLPVKLHHPAAQGVESLGCVGRVIVTADRLILDDQEVAIYGNGFWVFKGQAFTTVSIEAPARVHFAGDQAADLEDLAARGMLNEALPVVEQLDQYATELARLASGLTVETLGKLAEPVEDPNRTASP